MSQDSSSIPTGFNDWLYIDRYGRAIAPSTIDSDSKIVFTRGSGTRLWDSDGKEYIDFIASVGAAPFGNGHPKFREMLNQQAGTLSSIAGSDFHYHSSVTVGGNTYCVSPGTLADRVLSLMFTASSLGKCRFVYEVTGATAVNAAVKLCLKARPDRYHVIVFERAFHGRHGYALDCTNSKPIQKQDYPPSGIVVHRIPFPDSLENLYRAITALDLIPLKNVNFFLGEYVQGEGGFRWPVVKYMNQLLEAMREQGILVVMDEVQTGFGRTGKWFAYQHGAVVPDVVIIGKAFGGGLPVSGVGYNRESVFTGVEDEDARIKNGWHSATFLAYPLGVAAATITLDILKEEKLVERAEEMGIYLREKLYQSLLPWISDDPERTIQLTGFGLMQGLQFGRRPHGADPHTRNSVFKKLLAAEPMGIVTAGAGIDTINPIIRFEPPLTVTKEDIDYLCSTMSSILQTI